MKYKIGDKVIILRGHVGWHGKAEWKKMVEAGFASNPEPKNVISETDDWWIVEHSPELVGKEAIVTNFMESQGQFQYTLSVNNRTISWFSEKDIKTK